MLAPRDVSHQVLQAARMVVTEGLGEGRPAHGFFIIVGKANKIFADEHPDPDGRFFIKRCRYGRFRIDLDRRSYHLNIVDCLGEAKRIFLSLFHEDGAIVVDSQSGQLCCGGFIVHDLTSGIGTGSARTKAASAMATKADGCYVILASEDICGSATKPTPPNAAFAVFDFVNEAGSIPVRVSDPKRVSETVREVLKAARKVVTKGVGEGRPAHGFFIIVGDTNEIFANERSDPDRNYIKLCKYGQFRADLDRRSLNLKISDCHGFSERVFLSLFVDDGAVVVDGQTGQVCCGGFFVHDTASGVGTGGARTKAASAIATKAGGCYVIFASESICGSVRHAVPADAVFKVFENKREPQDVPVRESETVREFSLERWLRPLKIISDLRLHNSNFVQGTRQWVIDHVEDWRSDLSGSRCLVLLADPGFGKTAIAARLYDRMTGVLAIHFCRFFDRFKRDPRCMITSIAFQIAEILPQFSDALRKVYEIEGSANDVYSLQLSARELAERLLFDPLCEIEPPQGYPNDGRHLIIIDALDEAEHDAKNELLHLVAFEFHRFPDWVAVLVTARPHAAIWRKLASLRPMKLDTEEHKDKCDADVRGYLREILAPRFNDQGSLTEAIRTVATKSEGLFLYLHYIRDMLQSGDDFKALPTGLAGLYQMELERLLGPAGLGDNSSETRRVVEAIVLAQVPVHVTDELPNLSGVPHNVVHQCVTSLSRLLPLRDDGRVNLLHKSFAEWLTREKKSFDHSGFIIDRSAANRRLASACAVPLVRVLSEEADRFDSDAHAVRALEPLVEARGSEVDDSQRSQAFDEYALRWIIGHLVVVDGLEDVSLALLCSLKFLLKRAPQIDTLIAEAALFLPTTELLRRALLLAQNHVRDFGAHWLAEELWQRLPSPAETRETIHLKRLAGDGRRKARAELKLSARRAYFTAANSSLHCVLDGHSGEVKCVMSFKDAKGHTWVASCSDDTTICIWNPIRGGDAVHVLKGHSGAVNDVAAFLDANRHTRVASCSDDTTVRIWDPIAGGKAVHVLEGHSGCVNSVTAFPDAKGYMWMASCSNDETVRIWDTTRDGEAAHVLQGHSSYVLGVTAFVDANRHLWLLASSSSDRTVRIWNAINGTAVHVFKGHSRAVTAATGFVDAKGRTWVVSCSKDKTVCIWDPVGDDTAVRVFRGHSRIVNDVTAFVDAKNHTWVASCSDDNTVRIWDINDCNKDRVLEGHSGEVIGLMAFVDNKDRRLLASFSSDTTIRVWDPDTGSKAINVLKGHSGEVKGLTSFVDAEKHTWLTSCSSDKAVRIWDPMKCGEAFLVMEGHSRRITGVTAFADAKGHTWVASCSNDNTVRIWDPNKGSEAVRVLAGHSGNVNGVEVFADADDHKWMASCSDDATVRIWDPMKSADAVQVLRGHSLGVNGVTAFLDTKRQSWVASCSDDATVRIWDSKYGGDAEHVLKGHSSRVNAVKAFRGANGYTRVASCSEDKTVRIWDPIKGGDAVHMHQGHSSKVNAVTVFMDAEQRTWVTSCSDDKTIHVWDPIKGNEAVRELNGHSGDIYGLIAFTDANGHKRVASCSDDMTVCIWNPIKGGGAVHVLKGHTRRINGLTAYEDADGSAWVASWSDDLTVRIWDPTVGEASFVIPLESRAVAISILSAGSSGSTAVCLVIGHEDGCLSYWDHSLQCGDHE